MDNLENNLPLSEEQSNENLTSSNTTVEQSSPVVGFQAIDSDGNVVGFISKEEIVNEAKRALYADLAYMNQNKPMTLEISPLDDASTMAATDEYEDQLDIVSDAPFLRGLDANGNPIRISMADNAKVVGELLTGGLFIRKIVIGGNFCLKIAKSSIYKNTILLCGGRSSSVIDKSLFRKIQGDETNMYILEIIDGDKDPQAHEDNDYLYIGLVGGLDNDSGANNHGFLISPNNVDFEYASFDSEIAIKALPTVPINVTTPLTK